MRKPAFWLGVVCLFLGAILLRFWRLGEVPVSLYWDEVAILADARSIAATGQDMHGNPWLQAIFPSYGDYKLPVYIWLASLAVKVFGATEWAVRLPSALAGIGTVLIAGLFGARLFQKEKPSVRHALVFLTAGVVAFAPWSILFSRTGFEGHVGQALLGLSILLALLAKKNGKWRMVAVAIGAVATYAYFSIRFVWPVVFLAATLLLTPLPKKQLGRWIFTSCVVPLLVYALFLLPLYRSPWYAPSDQFRLSTKSVLTMENWPVVANQYKLQAGNTLFDKVIFHPKILIARELAKNYADHLSLEFLFFTGDPNLRHGTGHHGLFLWPLLVPFFIGWHGLFTKNSRQGWFLLIWWLVALLPASVPEATPHALRSLNALIPLSVVIGWGVWQGWDLLSTAFSQRWAKALAIGWVAIFIFTLAEFTSYYFATYPTASASEWQYPYKEVAQEIWSKRESVNEAWVSFDDRFYLWFLAYFVPAETLRELPFEDFQLRTLENIHFSRFPDDAESGKKALVVTRTTSEGVPEYVFSETEMP